MDGLAIFKGSSLSSLEARAVDCRFEDRVRARSSLSSIRDAPNFRFDVRFPDKGADEPSSSAGFRLDGFEEEDTFAISFPGRGGSVVATGFEVDIDGGERLAERRALV